MENGVDKDSGMGGGKPAVVKKYANRRLYNTATSSYVTLDELSAMVRSGEEFVVYDAKTGDDITRSVLTQIILEEDSKGRNLLPIGFLRQLISYYDDNLHAVLPRYLEVSMENFARHQDQMREYMGNTFGRFFAVPGPDQAQVFEEMAKQNMAFFQQAARMFSPFPSQTEQNEPPTAAKAEENSGSTDVESLKSQLDMMQKQLDALARQQKG